MPRFLDTNVIVRYATGDDEEKARACLALLTRLERGEETVVTTDLAIAEAVFTLESPRRYGLSKQRIREILEPIIALRGLGLPRKALYARAFDLYCRLNIGFADAFSAAYMEAHGLSEVYSYDRDFDRMEGLRRVEPQG